MNIIVTNDGNIPSNHAHSFNVMKTAQGFYQCGHDVEVVSLLSWSNLKDWLQTERIYYHYGISPSIKITLLPVANRDFFRKSSAARGFNRRAVRYFKKINPDLVYCRSYLSAVECINNDMPCMLETHTTLYDHPDLQKVFNSADSKFFLGCVTINRLLAENYMQRGLPAGKVLIADDAVDISQFDIPDDRAFWRKKLGLPLDKKVVLYAGSLYKEKGIELILKTGKKVRAPDVVFCCVGGTAGQVRQWNEYAQANAIKNIFFLGFKPNAEVPGYLKAADVLLMPYDMRMRYNVMDIETTSPLKLFEYMASRRPVISTDIPALRRIVKHNESAVLVEPDNVCALAEYIMYLLNNIDFANAIADTAYQHVQSYTWEKRCRRIVDYFTAIRN